ncbi:hypothetical protein [Nocardia brasiliensis]|uniref:hypothetical protein n=1 Tax=Nocardia brasiliensis TaxID=37326 RepID=UPI002456D46A|nr:hypothetical protein [Nocardia brasiliensis]
MPIPRGGALSGCGAGVDGGRRALYDKLPGARQRRTRRAAAADPVWRRNTKVAELLAARVGIYGTPYDQHDASAAGLNRCPVR